LFGALNFIKSCGASFVLFQIGFGLLSLSTGFESFPSQIWKSLVYLEHNSVPLGLAPLGHRLHTLIKGDLRQPHKVEKNLKVL
jgi:hypothetical protein